ncbi:MAG TPA: histidine kinase dimerization/phosphoacceptor domain -containing protein [Ignavibacteriaceae bacterium]|nr:histidine kinase dimerization/phosphoacceptor domain -containing protein [Ignavibacteriaceae bacterium]
MLQGTSKDQVTFRGYSGRKFTMDDYHSLVNEMDEGFCIIEMIFDENGRPYDYYFVETNLAFEKQGGPINALGKKASEVVPNLEDFWFQTYGKVALTGIPGKFQNYSEELKVYFDVYAYQFGKPGENLVAVLFKDISDKIKIERDLLKSNEKYVSTLDNMIEGCAIVGFDWTYLYVNDSNARHAHLPREYMIGRKMTDVLPGVEKSIFFKAYDKCLKERIAQNIESQYIFPDGSECWYEVIANPVPEGIFILSVDITERKRTELELKSTLEVLKENEAKLIEAQKMAKMGNVEIDLRTNKLYWSDEVYNIYERPKELGSPTFEEAMSFVHPKDIDIINQTIKSIADASILELDFRIIVPDNKIKHLAYYMKPIFENGVQIKRIGTVQDITEHKAMELILQDKILEKEILLRELYHRTKNNMQIISSLLSLKLTDNSDDIVRNVFEEMQGRIRSIALVHEKLYKSKNLSRLNLKEYIIDLVNLLIQTNSSSNFIKFSYDLEEITVLIETALSCGLIITELIQNSIKHAFPDNREGNINIVMKRKNENLIELKVCDNGIGMTDEDIFKVDKIGLQIFKSIAEDQLNAKVELITDYGTCWRLEFRDVHYRERV